MISDINIRDINHVQEILNDIRNYVKAYENQIGELSEKYSDKILFASLNKSHKSWNPLNKRVPRLFLLLCY